MRCNEESVRDVWVSAIKEAVRKAHKRGEAERRQNMTVKSVLRDLHASVWFQCFYAVIILLMFVNAIAIAELPRDDNLREKLRGVDAAFTFLFLVGSIHVSRALQSMHTHAPCPVWRHSWSFSSMSGDIHFANSLYVYPFSDASSFFYFRTPLEPFLLRSLLRSPLRFNLVLFHV